MENPPALPEFARAAVLGLPAAAGVGLVYGFLADPIGLSWGLIAVGLVGGWVIGQAVAHGAWSGRFHLVVARVRWLAVLLATLAWVLAAIVAYVGSQLFYQQAATSLGERLSASGLVEYLNGFVFGPSILGLAALALMAWRGTR